MLSYDRQAKVLKKSVAQFVSEYDTQSNAIFDEPVSEDNPANLINKVIQVRYIDNDKKKVNLKLRRYTKLCEITQQGEQINYNNVYPVINNPLAYFLGISIDDEETQLLHKEKSPTNQQKTAYLFRDTPFL